MSGARRIIYVPGLKPKPPPDVHRATLWRCVLEGVHRADSAVAAELAGRPECLRLVSWCHLFYPDYRDVGLDQPGIEGLLAERSPRRAAIAAAFTLRQRLAILGHRLGDRVPALIGVLAGPATLENLADTDRYFANRDGAAGRIRALLADALQEAWSAGESVLLMAHSLGSVIAFDTLWELGRRPGGAGAVDLFLTLGSPLGTRVIRRRLPGAQETGSASYPAGIRRWRNLAAIGELTALGHRFADDYREMLTLGLVDEISDRTDLVNPFIDSDGLNVHKCYGYFVNRATGQAIAGWWRSRP